MLNQLRSAAGTWVAKLLLILLVVSFAVWGISGQILGGASGNVVTVGGTRVSQMEYRLAYDRQISSLSQQFGTRITREQAQAFGLDGQVLGQIVAGAVLDEQAREMRLGLSRDRLAVLTAEDPAFHGVDGRFDRMQFEWVLRQVGMRPEDYLRSREQVAIRQQIVEAVADGLVVPDAFLEAVSLYRGEDRTAEFIHIPRAVVEPVEPPSDAVLSTWFEDNRAAYDAPEYRRISYVKLEPADIADPAAVSAQEVQARYEASRERYTTAERRTIEQVVFPDQAAAAAALEALRAGTSFEEIVAAQGRTMRDALLGTFEQARLADPAIAQAAFSLSEGETSEAIAGAFGPVIIRVTAIEPEVVRPLSEVEAEIREDLALGEANRIIMSVYDAYEDSRAAGLSMAEAAAQQRLEMVTVEAVDATGRRPDGTAVPDLPEADALLAESFEAETGFENPPINIGAAGYLFYEVEAVTPARPRTLDEVRERVTADWIEREAERLLVDFAAAVQRRLNEGEPLAALAAELELDVQTRRGLRRDGNDAGLGAAGIAGVFSVAQGESGVVAAPGGNARIVFQVTERFLPAAHGREAVPESLRDAFSDGLASDLLDQLVVRLQSQYSVTVDRAAIAQAMSF